MAWMAGVSTVMAMTMTVMANMVSSENDQVVYINDGGHARIGLL